MVVTGEDLAGGQRVSTEEADGQFCFQMIKLERLKCRNAVIFPVLAIVLLPSGKNIYIYYDSSVPSLTVLCELQTWMYAAQITVCHGRLQEECAVECH